MSLDNVLAVAGAAQEHPGVLVFGLVLSVALMGVASSYIARLLNRFHWIAWIGLLVILYVALKMCYEGMMEALPRCAARLSPRRHTIACRHRFRSDLRELRPAERCGPVEASRPAKSRTRCTTDQLDPTDIPIGWARSLSRTDWPESALRSAAMPQSTDIAPAREPARWPSRSAAPGLKSMSRSRSSPP